MGRTWAKILTAGVLLAPALPAPAAAAAPDPGPPYSDWNEAQPGYPSNAPQSRRATCQSGQARCFERTLGEMYRRFNTVIPPCDDNNVFSLTYIRVTEDIRRGVSEGYYGKAEGWLNNLDALFARPYFLAYDNYRAGRIDLVPPAWRIAFDAGRDGTVKGIGNLLLSMNAHVNRDFPFVLYRAGLVDGDGASLKPVHDAGNARLKALYRPMLTELSQRFDESIDDYDIPGVAADDDALFDVLVGWREGAWRNAELLAAAGSDAERRQVAASIESYALAQAGLIYAGSAYAPAQSRAARDARCAANGGQDPAYRRGSDVAHFSAATARAAAGRLIVPIRCPDGPGPCTGYARTRAGRERFSLGAGERGTLSVPLGPGRARGERLGVRLRSLLGPGDAELRRRRLRVT